MIKLNIQKSPIPLIWLDSSIIIHMAKSKTGKIDDELKEKVDYIYDTIHLLVRKRKLLCPSAEQEEEFDRNSTTDNECRKIQTSLSLRLSPYHRIEIEDYLIRIYMKSYIEKTETINLSYLDIFNGDPIKKIDDQLQKEFIVDVSFRKPKSFVDDIRKSKQSTQISNENARCHNIVNGITFEEELKKQFDGTHDGFIEKIRRYNDKVKKQDYIDDAEQAGFNWIISLIEWWDSCGGKPSGPKGLFQFLRSEYHDQIPSIEIMCNLFAKILTGSAPVKPSDSMDIQQLSCVVPFYNMLITDKTMRHYVESLKFDEKYGTKVFALNDFEDIKKFLTNL
jgi:hypothetical protein